MSHLRLHCSRKTTKRIAYPAVFGIPVQGLPGKVVVRVLSDMEKVMSFKEHFINTLPLNSSATFKYREKVGHYYSFAC